MLIDLGSARACDTLVLVGSNLSASASAALHGGSSPNPANKVADIVAGNRQVAYALFSEASNRYWAVRLDDSATTQGSVGYLILGKAASLETTAGPIQRQRRKTFRRIRNEFGLDLTGAKIFDGSEVSLEWNGLDAASADSIDSFLDSLDLTTNAALLLPEGRQTIEPMFARLQREQERIQETGGHYRINGARFITDDLGRIIGA